MSIAAASDEECVSSLSQVGDRQSRPHAPARAIVAGALGNALEWYDFAAYGFLAAIFARNFFPSDDPFVGLISAFGIFAASFLMRPLGGLVFGHIGDRHGRRRALYLSAALMTVSTVAIGFLPTYAQVGYAAPVLLLLLRLVQGLSIGGEYTMSVVFLAENAHDRRRGLVTSFASCSAGAGTLLGSAVGALTASLMSSEDLIAWGWRVPFLAGIGLGLFIVYLRSAPDEEAAPHEPHGDLPMVRAFREDGLNIARAVALSAMLGAGFYTLFVYLTTYMVEVDHLTERMALQINTVSMVALLVLGPAFAHLSDRVGRKPLMMAGLLGMLLLSWPLFRLLSSGDPFAIMAAQLSFAVIMSAYLGPLPATLVEMFRASARGSAVSISYNISLGLAGGTAPMIAVYLVSREHDDMGPAVYLMALAAISLVGLVGLKERAGHALDVPAGAR